MSRALPGGLEQDNGGRGSRVERFNLALQRHADGRAAGGAPGGRNAGGLGADDQAAGTRPVDVVVGAVGVGARRVEVDPGGDRRQVRRFRQPADGDVELAAGAGAHGLGAVGVGSAGGADHARRAGRGGAADHGADVARVLHAVQHQEQGGAGARRRVRRGDHRQHALRCLGVGDGAEHIGGAVAHRHALRRGVNGDGRRSRASVRNAQKRNDPSGAHGLGHELWPLDVGATVAPADAAALERTDIGDRGVAGTADERRWSHGPTAPRRRLAPPSPGLQRRRAR